MLVEDCQFIDNKAQMITGGITLNGAHLIIRNSVIENTEPYSKEVSDEVLAGFFYISAKSHLELLDGT